MTPELSPTVVLVHGAFAESNSWNGVIAGLQAHNLVAVAVANPLRALQSDFDYLSSILASIPGPVVLVAHSYGGMLTTEVGAASDVVKALVYVAAFAPNTGDSGLGLSGKFPGSTLGETLASVPLGDGVNDLSIVQERYHDQFMADVPASEARLYAATQRPATDKALGDTLQTNTPAWSVRPSWFVFGDADRNIPVEAHRFMADRAGSRRTIEVAGASHSVAASRPEVVVETILEAARSAHAVAQ